MIARRKYTKTKSEGKIAHKKTEVDGIVFHSKMESRYYEHLCKLKANGEILRFELQPIYLLQEKFIIVEGEVIYGSNDQFNKLKRKTKTETIQAIKYIADFKVYYTDGRIEVIDTKGQSTPDFEIKKKMLIHLHPTMTFKVLIESKNEWVDYYKYQADKRARKRNKLKLEEEK